MRNLMNPAAALATILSPVPRAQAQAPALAAEDYTFDKQQIGDWSVYGYRDKCWMLQPVATKETTVSFSFSKANRSLHIGAEDRGWTEFSDMKRYQVEVELGKVSRTMVGFGLRDEALGPLMVVFMSDSDGGDFFAMLRRANRLKLSLEGNVMIDLPMKGHGPAVDYFEKCAQALRTGPFNN